MTKTEQQSKRVTKALLTRPTLAAAVYKNLRGIMASPWFEMEEGGILTRETQKGSSREEILALVYMKHDPFDGRWVAEVFDPRKTNFSKKSEFETRKEAMDEADSFLEGMGFVLP